MVGPPCNPLLRSDYIPDQVRKVAAAEYSHIRHVEEHPDDEKEEYGRKENAGALLEGQEAGMWRSVSL